MPGQLRNLPVKIEQIEPLTLFKYWVKLNFFFEKILILHTIIHLKSLYFTKMSLGTFKLVLKGYWFGLKTSPIYTVIEYFILCPSVPQSASLPGLDSRSRSNHSQSLMASNFAALWSTDPKFLALKDLNPFKTVSKVHAALMCANVKTETDI